MFGSLYRYQIVHRFTRGLPYVRIEVSLASHFRDGEPDAPGRIGHGEGRAGLSLRLSGERGETVCTRYQPFLTWPYDLGLDPVFGAPYWTDLSAGGAGVAWLNQGDIGYRYDHEEHRLDNLLAAGTISETRWTVGLLPHDGDWLTGDVHRWGLNFGNPFHARYVPGHHGVRSRRSQLCAIAPDTVTVSSAFRSGGRNYVRLYEHAGQSADIRLTRDGERLAVEAVDLRLRPLASSGGLMLGPWQIGTVALP